MSRDRDTATAKAWNQLQLNWWAYDEVYGAVQRRPAKAWRLFGIIAKLAITDELISDLGCGPLEDFIRAHGPKFVGRIENRAAKMPRFRKALKSVWLPRARDEVSCRFFALGCQPIDVSVAPWQTAPESRQRMPAKGTRSKIQDSAGQSRG